MVEFSSVTGKRPVSLCESTRELCAKALDGFFGRRALRHSHVELTEVPEGFEQMAPREKYSLALDRIVKECPIYLNDGELIVGSASLGDAILPVFPARYKGESMFGWGTNHLTLGFDKALKGGMAAYEERVEERLREATDAEQLDMLRSLKSCLESLRVWHGRYMAALEEQMRQEPNDERLQKIHENLSQVPFAPPQTFYQALQSLWFLFAYARLVASWPGLGRIDEYLWPYLKEDLACGRTTEAEAKEHLAHFFIKGCEWVNLEWMGAGTGDSQHYQNILLGGVDASGKDISNPLTRMVLEIVAELPISDFPIAVRVNEQTPEDIYRLIALNTSLGGGVVAVYNESTVLKMLQQYGYPLEDAVRFANDGCWEVQVPGKTYFTYTPFDGYALLQKDVLHLGEEQTPVYESFEKLYEAYISRLTELIHSIDQNYDQCAPLSGPPSPFTELLEEGCLEKAKGYYELGPKYNVQSPHIGGFADVVNALLAIKTFVYDRQEYSLSEYVNMLRQNWEGFEIERRQALSLSYWGNDSAPADALAQSLYNDYVDICVKENEKLVNSVLCPAGISTFGRQTDWRNDRFAHAFGMKQGEILSANGGPTPGTDLAGATAVIRAHCKLDLTRMGGSTALDIKLDPSVFKDTQCEEVVRPLIDGFRTLGGFFMQIDTVDNELLRKAQENPDTYRSLNVRVSGWSARFITLNKEWQDTIIERTTQKEL